MPTPPPPARRRSRQPMAGVALAAVGGIALAEGVRVWQPGADDGRLGWTAGGVFLALAAAFLVRPSPWRFWAWMASGYAALHLFGADPLPAAVLAHALDAPAASVARASGTVRGIPVVSLPGPDAPPGAGGINRRFLLRLETVEVGGRRWDSHATVSVSWRDGPRALGPGDRLEISALASNVPPPRNPGEFDVARFLRRQGVRSEFALRGLADGRVVRPGGAWQPLALARVVHDWMQDTLCLDLRDEPDVCAVVATALLGLRDHPGLGPLEPVFQRTGTLHYFAIDGLKLGLVAFLVLRVLESFGVARVWAGLSVLPLLVGYALATGLGAASARAVLVAAVLVGGDWLDRPTRPFNALGAAAAVLLTFDTNQLFELGFQLTFAVVLAILTLARPIDEWLRRRVGPAPGMPDGDPPPWPRRAWDFLRRQTCGLTAVAIAAWLGSLPLMVLDFHVVSPISPLANVVAFPLAFAVLALGVFSLAGGLFSQTWVIWMNNANWLAARALLVVVRACDAVPGGSFAVAAPGPWRPWQPPPGLEIVVLDVGPARSALVRAGAAAWLLDPARTFDYRERVRPCLQARAVRRLDGLMLTRDDAGVAGSIAMCREDFPFAGVVLPAHAPRSAAAQNLRQQLIGGLGKVPVTFAHRGDTLPLSAGVRACVVYAPDEPVTGRSTVAGRALALRFEAAGWRVWWLPEGDGAATRWLLSHDEPSTLDGDVLVTDAPVSAEWLRAVHPRLVILRPPSARRAAKGLVASMPPSVTTMSQENCGAVTLEVYPDRVVARGFVDGRKMTIRK